MVVVCDSDFSRLSLGKNHSSYSLLGRYVSVLLDVEVFVALENVHVVVGVFDPITEVSVYGSLLIYAE